MTDRERFLARFRPAPEPPEPPRVPVWTGGADPEAFLGGLSAVGGEVRRASEGDWVGEVVEQARAWQVRSVVATGEETLRPALEALRREGMEVAVAGDPELRTRAERADLGLTGARWALASTGTVVLEAAPDRPRVVSLLPQFHLAVVREEDLLPDLGALVEGLVLPLPSALTFVTGPSRTADIEQTLVVGAHGPRRMGVVFVEADG